MTTTKSFSEKSRGRGVFASSFRRQASFAVATFIILFIAVVVPYLVDAPNHLYYLNNREQNLSEAQIIAQYYNGVFNGIYMSEGQPGFIGVMLAIMGFACALVSARYMHSKKMTDLYHALPVRREKMLLVNMLSSMLAILGPYTAIYLCTLAGQQIAYGRYGWVTAEFFRYIAMDFFTTIVLVWVIYSLTTFVAVNVGTTFDTLAISGTFLFMPTAVYGISGAVWALTTYGADFQGTLALRLSPFLFFFERFTHAQYDYNYYYSFGGRAITHDYAGIATIFAVWALIGCLFFGAALLCYRRRKSEVAEQTQPRGVFQTIVKFFVAFCGAFIFLAIFSYRSLPVQILVIILASVGIGLLAELILSRGVRALVKNVKWLALAGVVYGLLYLGLSLDVFGFESRVPAAANVTAVFVDYRGRFASDIALDDLLPTSSAYWNGTTLESPESIDIVRNAHLSLLDSYKNGKQEGSGGFYGRAYSYSGYTYSLTVRYQLKSGGELVRRYYNVDDASYKMLAALEGQEEFIRKNSPLFFMEEYGRRPSTQLEIAAAASPVTEDTPRRMNLDEQELDCLIDALQNDMLRQPLEEVLSPTRKTQGYIRLTYRDKSRAYEGLDEAVGWIGYGVVMDEREMAVAEAANVAMDVVMYSQEDDLITEYWVPVSGGYTETLALLGELDRLDLLRPDYEKIHEVRVTDLFGMYRLDSHGAVQNIMPFGMGSYRWRMEEDNGEGTVFRVRDPDEIDALADRSIGCMLVGGELSREILVMQFYDEEGEPTAIQFVRLEDLPDSIRESAAAYLEQRADVYVNTDSVAVTYSLF